jgi:hypothetical protein
LYNQKEVIKSYMQRKEIRIIVAALSSVMSTTIGHRDEKRRTQIRWKVAHYRGSNMLEVVQYEVELYFLFYN